LSHIIAYIEAKYADSNQCKESDKMVKLIFLGIGALLLIAVIITAFQYLVISFLKRREEDDA